MSEFKATFNPLRSIIGKDVDEMISGASLIADALIPIGEGAEVHWDEAFKQFLEALILHVSTALGVRRSADLGDRP